MTTSDQVAQLLAEIGSGRRSAAERLLPLVYDELRGLARAYFRRQPAGHTLQPTALVHEAYAKLVQSPGIEWSGRGHFFAVAARAMRQILMTHARDRKAQKRGGGAQRVTLCDFDGQAEPPAVDLLALDDALTRLRELDERQAEVVELRYFGGLTNDEIAQIFQVSRRTIESDWRMARAWLLGQLGEPP